MIFSNSFFFNKYLFLLDKYLLKEFKNNALKEFMFFPLFYGSLMKRFIKIHKKDNKELRNNILFLKQCIPLFLCRDKYIGLTSTFKSNYVDIDKSTAVNIPFYIQKGNRLNFKNFIFLFHNIFKNFFKNDCNIRFVKVIPGKTTANFFCNLLCNKIIKYGRPDSRRNKLNKKFFISFLNNIRKDRTISGFKIFIAGRINRRGRAMWQQYNFGKIPKGTFKLGLDFARQSIKTVNGILTLKMFLFRYKNNEIKYSDYLLLKPFLLGKEYLMTKTITSFSNFLSLNSLNDLIVKKITKKMNEQRKLKKLRKSSIIKERFFVL
jgi:hypothetical protein